jgi:hypothetical protein
MYYFTVFFMSFIEEFSCSSHILFSSQAREKLWYYYEATEKSLICGVNDNVIGVQLTVSTFLYPSSSFWPVLTNHKHLSVANYVLCLALLMLM